MKVNWMFSRDYDINGEGEMTKLPLLVLEGKKKKFNVFPQFSKAFSVQNSDETLTARG